MTKTAIIDLCPPTLKKLRSNADPTIQTSAYKKTVKIPSITKATSTSQRPSMPITVPVTVTVPKESKISNNNLNIGHADLVESSLDEDVLEKNLSDLSIDQRDVMEEENPCSPTVQDQQSTKKKRNTYTKDPDKKTGKEAFLEDYVYDKDSIFKDWIVYNEKKDTLFCSICIAAQEKTHNVWGDPQKGSSGFSKQACERHTERDCHERAIKVTEQIAKGSTINMYFEKKEPKKTGADVDDDSEGFRNTWPTEYKNLFLNIYWGCKKELAINAICDLHKHTKFTLNTPMPDYHLSFKSNSKIIASISHSIRNELLKEIQDCNHIGILIDESKDTSDKEILLLYIRYWSKQELKVKEVFVASFYIKRKTASVIYETIKPWLIEKKLWGKIKFLCTDAAANVSSEQNGVAGLLQNDIKTSLSYKCLAHAENTALRHTYKHFISYIDGSPKRFDILTDAQSKLEYENTLHIIKAIEIRWNTFFLATDRTRELYPAIYYAIVDYLKEARTKIEEKEILEIKCILLDFNFLYTMRWLSDFLKPIVHLNKQLQGCAYELASVKEHTEDTIRILNADYINFERPPLSNPNNLDEEVSIDEVMQRHLRFGGFRLSLFLSNCIFISKDQVKYTYADNKKVILNYTKLEAFEYKLLVLDAARFLKNELASLIPGKGNFFKNFLVFDFDRIQGLSTQDLNAFGNKEINNLANHYFADHIGKELLIFEWNRLKLKISDLLKKDFDEKIKQTGFVRFVLSYEEFSKGYEVIIELIEIYSALACSNAGVERGFSAMNRIKTDIRNKLSPDSLEDLMMISLNGGQSGEWSLDRLDTWMNYWNKAYDLRYLNN